MPQLRRFWNDLQTKLANEQPYEASIGNIKLKLQELQQANCKAKELMQQKADSYEEIDEILHHQGLPFVLKAIWTKLISHYYDNPLAGYFDIKKTCKLLAKKYYWPTLRHDVGAYVKDCDVCLASKAVPHKPYGNLQLLPIPTHQWKNFLMDFVTSLRISIDWKKDNYISILVIIDWLMKMVNYKPVKITFNVPGLAKVIIDVIVYHYKLSDSIVTNRGSLFTSKF